MKKLSILIVSCIINYAVAIAQTEKTTDTIKPGPSIPIDGGVQQPTGGQIETTSTSVTEPDNTLATTTTNPSNGCIIVMGSTSFAAAKNSIMEEPTDNLKLATAKQITKNNCISSAQLTEVMNVFTNDVSRLDFAKYAYDHITDKNNYSTVSTALSSELSKMQLTEFIESKKE